MVKQWLISYLPQSKLALNLILGIICLNSYTFFLFVAILHR
uniref:Uncharacterized protein n=1 Tax=Anguilla anguilla TaxID=7936 RepID=A0A0E9UEK1_ANGAN